jgi:erythromycin esterase-like protein
MDLFSLPTSAESVIKYLKEADAEAARRARKRYDCFARFDQEPQVYGLEVASKITRSCEKEVTQQFEEMQQRFAGRVQAVERQSDDALFFAYQSARVVKSAEAYYRAFYRRDTSSWNVRDRHMAETLDALLARSDSPGGERARVIVWAHNTHQGDARMTERASRGELSVGQLMRQRYGQDAVLIGFTTYEGKVRAASEWGGRDQRKTVRLALAGSFSALLHEAGIPNFLLQFRNGSEVAEGLSHYRLERAIGAVYLPRKERTSHYFFTRLSKQFDAVIHFDVTSAVEPLY